MSNNQGESNSSNTVNEVAAIDADDPSDTELIKDEIDISENFIQSEDDNSNHTANETTDSNLDQQVNSKSRELKSILALSKEANLSTNIEHKRKSIDPSKSERTDDSKRHNSAEGNLDERKLKTVTETQSKAEDGSRIGFAERETKEKDGSLKSSKRKKDSLGESSVGGVVSEQWKRTRKLSSLTIVMNNKKKDPFCWRCHHEDVNVFCETCPRSFHLKCLKQAIAQPNHWICPECATILKAENVKQRSPALKNLPMEHLCSLLKFAIKRMLQVQGCEPFIHPVSQAEFPDYKHYIVQPMDLTCLEKNIKDNVYGSTQAFEADAKWIVHNSIIFNSYQSKLTSIAKSMLKICKQEMSEIENCANCYLNANTMKKTWFVEVCPKPHLLVWAKLKGFPYWPAKAMRTNSQSFVDVRFFGAHDRAWIPSKECFMYSEKDPNSTKVKRNDINESVKELNVHIENLKKVYAIFQYAPYRTTFDPEQELKHLQFMLPHYNPNARTNSRFKRISNVNGMAAFGKETEREEEPEKVARRNVNSDEKETEENKSADLQDKDSEINISEEFDSTIDSSDANETDCSESVSPVISNPIRVGKVRMRGGLTNVSGKLKTIPKLILHDAKNTSNGNVEYSDKNNSDVNSDSNILSTVSDKINKVDISENMEISLSDRTAGGNLSIRENISNKELVDNDQCDVPSEAKRKPIVQVNISGNENHEFTISPHSKSNSTIADRLLRKLSEELESVKKKLTDNVDPLSLSNNIATENVNGPSNNSNQTEKAVNLLQAESKADQAKGTINVVDSSSSEPSLSNTTKESNELLDGSSTSNRINMNMIDDKEDSSSEDLSSDTDSDNFENEPLHPDTNGTTSTENKLSEENEKVANEQKDDGGHENMETGENSGKALELLNRDAISTIIENPHVTLSKIQSSSESPKSTNDSSESETKKRKRSTDSNPTDEPTSAQSKIAKVSATKTGPLDGTSKSNSSDSPENAQNEDPLNRTVEPDEQEPESILTSVVIKSEPSSDDEPSDSDYMEMKRQYLSALNLNESEKRQPVVARRQSGTEERPLNSVDNLSKVIDAVAKRYSEEHANEEIILKPSVAPSTFKKKEIFVKPLAKMQNSKLQRARKSFPMPIVKNVYSAAVKKDLMRVSKSLTAPAPSLKVTSAAAPPKPNDSNILLVQTGVPNPITILPPNQPICYSSNIGNPILTMVQQPQTNTVNNIYAVSSSVNATPSSSNTEYESQNYIPQSGALTKLVSTAANNRNISSDVFATVTRTVTLTTPSTSSASLPHSVELPGRTSSILEELEVLSSVVPESITKAVSDTLCRAPPKLKPRPPGPLSTYFDEGVPSTAGRVTSMVNSVSHRINDYFRGMMVELLQEVGSSSNPEAEITKLKLEIEELKHRHTEEILEIKKNISIILKDVQKSLIEEKSRVIEETRSSCEVECLKRVEEAKSKQWCASCSKEAQFYCCWNTSYCDYPCQQKHWPKHMSKCTQNIQNPQQLQNATATSAISKNQSQPLVLRQTSAPKGFTKTLIAKPTKVYVSRPGNKSTFNFVRSSPGNHHITLVESTPGNYELVGNGGPISIGGKFMSGMGKFKNNIISVSSQSTSVSPSTSKIVTNKHQLQSSTPKLSSTSFTTVVSDDDCD